MNWHSKIILFEAKKISCEIVVPFAISSETLTTANFVLVKIRDENGVTGIGEASPFPTLTGDNVAGVYPVVSSLLDQLRNLTSLAAIQHLKTLREETFLTSPSAYVGVEMALWDLYARQLGVPLAALWGGCMLPSAVTDITLPIMVPLNVESFWSLFRNHGFDVLKIKVSGHLNDDLDMIHAIVKLVSKSTQLTLDGNQGYQADAARTLLRRLEVSGIRPMFFEQPLPADDWEGLKWLEETTGTPICLDETVVTPENAIRVVRDQTASMINLKIMKSGIAETLRIIAIAQSAGISLMIGGMLESEIAMATSLQLACGIGGIQHFDLDTPFFFKDLVCEDSPWHRQKSELIRSHLPGNGLTVRP
jgi:L-Ala-D/L-Glu epimerase